MHHARNNQMLCEECGSNHVHETVGNFPFEYGLGENRVTLSALLPYYECESCGLQWTAPEAERIQTDAIAVYLGRMSSTEIRQIRQESEMTQEAFARFAEVSIASLKRWEAGHIIPSPMSSSMLESAKARLKEKTIKRPIAGERFRTNFSEKKRLAARVYNFRVPFPLTVQQAA